MAIEQTANTTPRFSSSDLSQTRAATRGTYFVQQQPAKSAKLAKPAQNIAKILSMKQQQRSVFDEAPEERRTIAADKQAILAILKRAGIALGVLVAVVGVGYAIYRVATAERTTDTATTANNDAPFIRRLDAISAQIDSGDYASAENALKMLTLKDVSSCTKAYYYTVYARLYIRTGRGNTMPVYDTMDTLSENITNCTKEKQ